MKTASRKIRTSFISAAAVLFAAPLAAQAVTVDGQYDDWDLENDFSMPMYRAGNPDKDLLSNAYLRYDSNTSTVFVLVLEDEGALVPLSDTPDNAWAKVYSLGQQTLVSGNSGNDGMAPDFEWVMKDDRAVGWEGAFKLVPGSYGNGFEIHVNHGGETSSTGKQVTAGEEKLNTVELTSDNSAGYALTEADPPVSFDLTPDPKLDIETYTQGFDADTPTGPYIEIGDPVYRLSTVKNTGNVPLSNIVVTDGQGLVLDCDGDNIIDSLQPDEVINCTARTTASVGQQVTLGAARTDYEGTSVQDEDASYYFGAEPGLDLQVCTGSEAMTSCSEGSADDHDVLRLPDQPGFIVLEDEPVVYTYTATNTGNIQMDNVVVTDDSGLPVDCGDFDGTLAVGESVTCTVGEMTVQGPHESAGQADADYTVVNEQGNEEQRSLQDWDGTAYYALSQEQPSLVLTVTDFAVTGGNNEFNNGTFIVENASGDLDVTAVAITKADVTVEYRSSGKGKTSWVDAGISKNCTTDPAVPFVFEGEGEKSGTPGQQEVAFNCTADADTIPADYSAVRATVCVQIANRYVKEKGKVTDEQKWFCSSSDM